ncbi:uncharacterized protein LOC134251572 [Saccostrea cucullata]|uniref:uncharacterized protein LOC134251572 n=1 Tax=Saccostrea cuccullata TaxID=36930 RepID=UPI002ED44F38
MQFITLKNVTRRDGEFYCHGIPYADFDRTGHWGIWNIARMFEACRRTVSHKTNFFLRDTKGTFAFAYVVRRQTFKLSQKIHDNISLFSRFLPKITYKMVEIGNSSFTVHNELYDDFSGSSEVFAENFTRIVKINWEKKQSTELSREMREELEDIYRSPSEIWQNTTVFPDRTNDIPIYTLSLRVPFSDTDSLQHITHVMYSKYCTDCATNAINAGFYRHFKDDICWYPILEMDIEYLGDAIEGEIIDIHTWQGENPQHLYFETKTKGKIINKAMFVIGLEKSRKNRHSKM